MLRNNYIALLGLALSILSSCSWMRPGNSAAWNPCAQAGTEPFARLSISGGIVGVNESLAVRCDGSVERDGGIVRQDTSLVQPLIARLRDSGVLELQDAIHEPDGQCNDCFLYELELADGMTIRRWRAVETAMPEQLATAIAALREVDTR